MKPEKTSLINAARIEWTNWGRQTWNLRTGRKVRNRDLTDDEPALARFIRDVYCPAGNSTATVEAIQGDVYAWSAVFISFVFRQAQAVTGQFKFSAAHHSWIRAAVAARRAGDADALFWAFRIGEPEAAPQPGDLVAYARGEPSPSFARAQAFFDRTTPYTSHSDLVVAVRPGEIDVIGGNVSDTVLMKTVPIDSQGRLADQTLPWFAVLRRQVP